MTNRERIDQLVNTLALNPLDPKIIEELFVLYTREGILTDSHRSLYAKLGTGLEFLKLKKHLECDYLLLPPDYICFYTKPTVEPFRFSLVHKDSIKSVLSGREKNMIEFQQQLNIFQEIGDISEVIKLPIKHIELKNITSPVDISKISKNTELLRLTNISNLDISNIHKMVGHNLYKLFIYKSSSVKDLSPIVAYIKNNSDTLYQRNLPNKTHNFYSFYLDIDITNSVKNLEVLKELVESDFSIKIELNVKSAKPSKNLVASIENLRKTFLNSWVKFIA